MSALGTTSLMVLVPCVVALARAVRVIVIVRTAKSLVEDCDSQQRADLSARLVGVLAPARRPSRPPRRQTAVLGVGHD
jgi:hypothetical protein